MTKPRHCIAPPASSLTDLHGHAFLGRRPRLGLACDWVWWNVPHGPLK
jgi:hypothetical protein